MGVDNFDGCYSRVLGIGDAAYDGLSQELRDSLDEYYKVDSLEDYEKRRKP